MKTLTTLADLRDILGEPNAITYQKIFPHLSEQAIEFIGESPMLMLSTIDANGRSTVSPKGDHPGFVHVADKKTLYLPERAGNRLIFTLQNILATGQVGMLFMRPNTTETLRVNGRCELIQDDDLCQQLATRGKPALLILKITVEECFFHCAKAFLRSQLWKPESWGDKGKISFGREFAENNAQFQGQVEAFDKAVAEGYKTTL
ncbi:MAG: MSMEG_1061 family FMN-dependent PPOX-type flavoprotein [Chloroflexota bacterium]